MTIDNLIIDADIQDIINELTTQLDRPLFLKTRDIGEDLMVQCPYHKDGQERTPSMGIRKEDGMCHCLACGETHSLPEMIADCFGKKYEFGFNWLKKNFTSEEVQEREHIKIDLERDNTTDTMRVLADNITNKLLCVSEEELDSYRYIHPYMYERGLTDEIIEKFDIGYDKNTDSITFPVRELNGRCLFVARRTIKYKSFNIPKGVDKPLYGYHEVCEQALKTEKRLDKIYLCEGLFDSLRLWCNNKYACAGFGCLYNQLQMFEIDQLPTRTLVLALDNDDAGKAATETLKRHIKNKIIKTVVLPKGRKDIGECTDEEIQNLEEIIC